MTKTNYLKYLILSLTLAIVCSTLSVYYQSTQPFMGVVGNLCGLHTNELCISPILQAGWPLPFIFDDPSVSVPYKIAFFEDTFNAGFFCINVVFYYCVISFITQFVIVIKSQYATNNV